MNEENDWDHNVAWDAVEGPVDGTGVKSNEDWKII